VLAGRDLDSAMETHDAIYAIWRKYGALPERFLLQGNQIHSTERYYPLRPEFVESTYYLYRATGHPYFLQVSVCSSSTVFDTFSSGLWCGQVGKDIYKSLESVTRVANGYASVRNVGTGELEDRMTSFFLAETCKYLYLLFDEDNFLHKGDRTYVFSTEGNALAYCLPADTLTLD